MTTPPSSSFNQRPATRLGWLAVGMAAAFSLLYMVNSFVFMPTSQNAPEAWWRTTLLPFYGILMILCGLAAGILGLLAVIRKRERSWLVWLALLPGLLILFLLLGEFLVPH